MKNFLFIALLIALSEIRAIAQSDGKNANVPCCAVQSNSYKSVLETLTERNLTLQLAAVPASQFPFHLFRNGLELTPGADYTLQGSVVTLTPKNIQAAGTLFEAAYVRQLSDSPSADSANTARAVHAPDEILSRYLKRSLEAEMDAYAPAVAQEATSTLTAVSSSGIASRGTSTPSNQSTEALANFKPHPRGQASASDLESFRMLSAAFSRSVATEPSRRKGKHHLRQSDDTDADGVEGMGDAPINSPYDILSDRTGGIGTALDAIDDESNASHGSSRSTREAHVPESLRLLMQRFGPPTEN